MSGGGTLNRSGTALSLGALKAGQPATNGWTVAFDYTGDEDYELEIHAICAG
ncbi:hypothetical protein HTZ77_13505 [Nonomuraea sp. SMC257]|uniref:Uncharacterized protein n=1 Tax=Nonomuraea montanisoli TaxID=2741721 RepID=A0A7Y6I784_9ACTN|nr:hypothetical protein [Nonomuraea montanisoli]NUW32438.1 hypothetical protein [Nonomuraea montanisoli]